MKNNGTVDGSFIIFRHGQSPWGMWLIRVAATMVCLALGSGALLLAAEPLTSESGPHRLQIQSGAGAVAREVGVSETDDRIVVQYAGATVRFLLPREFDVAELPFGREVRLLAGVGPLPKKLPRLDAGLWMSYHRNPPGLPGDVPLSPALLKRRIELATEGRTRLFEANSISLAGVDMLRQDFETPVNGKRVAQVGFHLLGKTAYGWFELNAVAAKPKAPVILSAVDALLSTLRIEPPRVPMPKVAVNGRSGVPIGSWKAVGSRMRIRPDGHITLLFDRRGTFAINRQGGGLRFDHEPIRLSGQYRATEDLLNVTWSDGSRQNFRWRFSRDGDLLLTDHTGRVSQLKWLFE